jgi:hypothetical protein
MKYSGGFTKLHIIFLLALITLILSSVTFAARGENSNRNGASLSLHPLEPVQPTPHILCADLCLR